MTSLQKAVVATKNSRSSLQTPHGHFERCFADGLDLTEFCSGSQPSSTHAKNDPPPRESAAAQLLRVKEEEKRRKEEEELAETKMQNVVEGSVSNIKEAVKKNRQSSVVVEALVQMHGSDTCDPSMYRINKKLIKKIRCNRRTVSVSAGKAHKKKSRTKH